MKVFEFKQIESGSNFRIEKAKRMFLNVESLYCII